MSHRWEVAALTQCGSRGGRGCHHEEPRVATVNVVLFPLVMDGAWVAPFCATVIDWPNTVMCETCAEMDVFAAIEKLPTPGDGSYGEPTLVARWREDPRHGAKTPVRDAVAGSTRGNSLRNATSRNGGRGKQIARFGVACKIAPKQQMDFSFLVQSVASEAEPYLWRGILLAG
jgi:hypothetical protein